MNTEPFIKELNQLVIDSNINSNEFFRAFAESPLPPDTTTRAFQQYFYYIRTFPQILAGLSHRVESEEVRLLLAKTVVSELGGSDGAPHFRMFEDVLSSIGVFLSDYRTAEHIPAAERLVSELRSIFLEGPVNSAVGAHFVIEETGLPMIRALYEGFRHYNGITTESMAYFYLHLFIECQHVDWISDAVRHAAVDDQARDEIRAGAVDVLELLGQFWQGLYFHYYASEANRSPELAQA